jgi:tetratricopeptide (TPR) repeat protein
MGILHAASVLLVTCVACGGEAPETAPPTPVATATPSASEHLDTGLDHLEQGEPEQARAEFEEALRLDPGYALAHYNLGQMDDGLALRRRRRGRPAEASFHPRSLLARKTMIDRSHQVNSGRLTWRLSTAICWRSRAWLEVGYRFRPGQVHFR